MFGDVLHDVVLSCRPAFLKVGGTAPWGRCFDIGGSNAKMGGLGRGGNKKWAFEGRQCSSCSCYHEGRVTEGIPGEFSFANP